MKPPPFAWQIKAWRSLNDRQQQDRMLQSILINGQEGVGKYAFSRELAKTGLCLDSVTQSCGQCNSCRQFEAGAHPDFLELAPLEGKREIVIDQIREFCRQLQLTPSQSHGRYAIVRHADRLNMAAANALLKTLEEPPRSVVMLLTADQLSRIPPTIRSRCSRVHIPMPTSGQATTWLNERFEAQTLEWKFRSMGPCNLQEQEEAQAFENLFRSWEKLLSELQRSGNALVAASQIPDADFERFLRWWQEALLDAMRQGALPASFRRLWDALINVRRQAHGNANRLLTMEGLFILYLNLAQSRQKRA